MMYSTLSLSLSIPGCESDDIEETGKRGGAFIRGGAGYTTRGVFNVDRFIGGKSI